MLQKLLAQKSPNPTDRHVGSRVCMRRKMLSMSQTDLADAVGVTFQQIQKYEKERTVSAPADCCKSLAFFRFRFLFSSKTREDRRDERVSGKCIR
jgi:transcriptional regulator with XRE-family HTH domain